MVLVLALLRRWWWWWAFRCGCCYVKRGHAGDGWVAMSTVLLGACVKLDGFLIGHTYQVPAWGNRSFPDDAVSDLFVFLFFFGEYV